jgi:hypothetical protein
MNSILPSRFARIALLAVALIGAPFARAITITGMATIDPNTVASANPGSFTINGPNGLFADLQSENQPFLTTLNFTDPNLFLMTTIASAELTLKVGGLDTTTISFDFNKISLGLGNWALGNANLGSSYFNTGMLLDGSNNSIFTPQTLSFNQNVINGAAILALLQGNLGVMDVGLIDATNSPSNDFGIYGGVLTLTLSDQPIPFTPTQWLGLMMTGGVAGFARWRRNRRAAATA